MNSTNSEDVNLQEQSVLHAAIVLELVVSAHATVQLFHAHRERLH